jgi:hypothetical protein
METLHSIFAGFLTLIIGLMGGIHTVQKLPAYAPEAIVSGIQDSASISLVSATTSPKILPVVNNTSSSDISTSSLTTTSSEDSSGNAIGKIPCDTIVNFDVFKSEDVKSFSLRRPCHSKDMDTDYMEYNSFGWSWVNGAGENKQYSLFYKPENSKCSCGDSWIGYFDTSAIHKKYDRYFIASSSLKLFSGIPGGFFHVEAALFTDDKPYVVLADGDSVYIFSPEIVETKKLFTVPPKKMLCTSEMGCSPDVKFSEDKKSLLVNYYNDDFLFSADGNGSTTIFLPIE